MSEAGIARIGEFVDIMSALLRGNPVVMTHDGKATIDGDIIYYSLPTLLHYNLVEEYKNKYGFSNLVYLQATKHGLDFAHRAVSKWNTLPLLTKLLLRFSH